MTNFTIEQIIALSQAGFSADQINGFAMGQPVQQTPVQQIPVQQIPVQQTPVQQIPVQQTPAQQIPVQQTPAQQIPVQQTPAQQIAVQQAPAQQIPVQQIPVQQTPAQQIPVQQTPAQQIPQLPANQAPGGDISGQLLTLIKTIQSQNLANASGQTPTAQTAEDIGLEVLGKTGGEN